MSLYPRMDAQRYTSTADVGKTTDTGLYIEYINKNGDLPNKFYFNDATKFLVSSTAGYVLSTLDVSNLLLNDNVENYSPIKKLDSLIKPYTIKNSANGQIDFAFSSNLAVNDMLRLVFKANYASAQVTLVLANDSAFTNSVTFNIVGGAVVSGVSDNISTVKLSEGTTAGSFNPASVAYARVIGVNQTSSNVVTPIALYNANNWQQFAGEKIGFKVCCISEPNLANTLETLELTCGSSVVGEDITSDSYEFSFTTIEESPDLISIGTGSPIVVIPETYKKHVAGYEPGQIQNKIVTDSTRGSVTISPNTNIKHVVVDCTNLQLVDYSTSNLTKLSVGQYSYDSTTGKVYFHADLVGLTPEIVESSTKDFIVNEFIPKQLGFRTSIDLQEKSRNGILTIFKLKEVTFKRPETSLDDQGRSNAFTLKVKFGQKGDIRRLQAVA